MAPCLLIFEDLDSLVADKTRSYFLNEVDGLESNDGILMIGSTNHLDRLDPAVMKRPSRFDRKYHFELPNEAERLAYCRYWHDKLAGSDKDGGGEVLFPEEICPIIAQLTEGFSFAFLKELFITSLLIHARGDDGDIEDPVAIRSESVMLETVANKDQASPETKKKVLPMVDIPEVLQGIVLLRIVKSQARLLLEEMDHATSENAAGKACGPEGQPPLKLFDTNPIDKGDEE